MPELRCHLAADRMDRIDHALPACERLFSPEQWNVGVVPRASAAYERALGKNEADAARRAARVIADVVIVGNGAGRAGPRHGSHHDAIRKLEAADTKRTKQRCDVGHA